MALAWIAGNVDFLKWVVCKAMILLPAVKRRYQVGGSVFAAVFLNVCYVEIIFEGGLVDSLELESLNG